jgi:hypothetical protein
MSRVPPCRPIQFLTQLELFCKIVRNEMTQA